jgi:outer membrane protein assembly factor BamE (lipoprotein component of BamABCDE complex)
MKPPTIKSGCRRIGWAAIAAGAMMLAGCLIIPTDYHAAGSRRNLDPKTPATLRPGVTTKEEIFLSLGEPDFVSEDGRRLGYAWTKVKAIYAIAGPYGGGASGEVQRSYVLEASFDASNRVSDVRLLKEWGPSVTPRRELEKSAAP